MDWHALPTAWIHFLVVESFPIYLATATWHSLIVNVNSKILEIEHDLAMSGITSYYSNLYFLGHALDINLTFNGGEELELPEAWANGVNLPWFTLAWILPIGAMALYIHGVVNLLAKKLWSFEDAAYISCTLQWVRTPFYKVCIYLMCISPVLLPVVWLVQVALYTEGDEMRINLAVFSGSTLNGILLLLSLHRLANPSQAYHNWLADDEFKNERLRRDLKQLFSPAGSNSSFAQRFMDALWSAQNNDMSRLLRFVDGDTARAEALLKTCREKQEDEPRRRADGTSGEAASGPAPAAGARVALQDLQS